jgi:hypothetical protein
MAKILFQNRWFEELAPTSVYESVFEGIVKAHALSLWPRFHAVRFKAAVYAENTAAKPDFALVEHGYREWWVVEVEMEHHSLDGHVLPQIRTLAEASYGKDEATKLCESCPDLDVGKVTDMMKGRQPRVLVVVNKPRPEWIKPLAKHDASLAVFEVFRSDRNEYLFRVNGEHPIGPSEVVSLCRFDSLITRWLVVDSPAGLGVSPQGKVQIIYHDHLTEWQRIDVSDKVWLLSLGPNPLSEDYDYEILRRGDGQFMFRETPKRPKR